MVILHACVCDSTLYIWGESPPRSPLVARKRTTRRPKADAVKLTPLPYDTGKGALLEAVGAVGGSMSSGGYLREMILWVPGIGGVPIPSSPLVAEPPESQDGATMAPWTVTALSLPNGRAVDFLCACADKTVLAPGVIPGPDLLFLARAMRFAAALVVRQQFLPGVVKRDSFYFARWEPIFTGMEGERLARLARAMPSACRALAEEPSESPPASPPVSTLTSFLGSIVDHLVRLSAENAVPSRFMPAAGRKRISPAFSSLHDQWLHSLRSDDGKMTGSVKELEEFAHQVREWVRPIAAAASSVFRLCFRLEEPEDDDGGDWRVRYLLQPMDDPSLLVPAEVAWTARGSKAAALRRGDSNPKEYLLFALGQASGICPHIEASLKTAAPAGYRLDGRGGYEFLTQRAWALEQAGFGVLLPAWWTRRGTKLKLSARASVKSPKMKGGAKLSLEEIVRFDWEVALGEQTLSLGELQALARLKSPLVKIRGQWVELNPEEIQAAVEFWKKRKTDEGTLRDVVQMALGMGRVAGGIHFEGVRATGWIADLLDRLEGRTVFEELPAPGGFRGSLRPYQIRGFSWMDFLHRWGLGACLADDMGLGKTIQPWHLSSGRGNRTANGPYS